MKTKKEFPLAGFPNSGNYLDIGQTQSTSKLQQYYRSGVRNHLQYHLSI